VPAIPLDDGCVDRRRVARSQQKIDRFPDEIGARAPLGGRALIERGQPRVVELNERLTSRPA
jgi:hypothetical protein